MPQSPKRKRERLVASDKRGQLETIYERVEASVIYTASQKKGQQCSEQIWVYFRILAQIIGITLQQAQTINCKIIQRQFDKIIDQTNKSYKTRATKFFLLIYAESLADTLAEEQSDERDLPTASEKMTFESLRGLKCPVTPQHVHVAQPIGLVIASQHRFISSLNLKRSC